MEIIDLVVGSGKAQMMTILVLVMFLLMVSALFAFSLLNISANSASQSLSVSLSSMNYGTLLKQSANLFAKESASRALITLANYEYNASLRKGNLIPSFGFYASNLMVSGILPNDISGYPQNAMGNLTFASYNSSILSRVSFTAQNIIINETTPVFFQTDPYHLRVSYVESVALNVTGAMYRYSIPVNVSIALNNTPDLFYAQQGILKTVKFASLGNLTSQIGGVYATSGNSVGFAYGTIYGIPSSATSSAACASIPSTFSSAPYSGNIIIATYNSYSMSACIGSYAGLITYILPSSGYTAMPYLVYSSASGILSSLPSGMRVLLYGPGMDTLNVEGLRNAVMNGQYFASPFTPSYIDRSGTNFLNQSPNGIFTFSNYNTQAGNFNGASSYVNCGSRTVSIPFVFGAWVNPNAWATSVGLVEVSDGSFKRVGLDSEGTSNKLCIWYQGSSSNYVSYCTSNPPIGAWTYVAGVINGTGSGNGRVYYNGVPQSMTFASAGTPAASVSATCILGAIDTAYDYPFNGRIADAQIYSAALSPSQIQQLYQDGISSLPISGNSLAGWWPLNGNANDLSGSGNSGAPTNVIYTLPSNYLRDSILVAPTPSPPQPVPGVLSCTSNGRCSSSSLPNLYLSYMPLEVQSGLAQTGNFNGASSYISVAASSIDTGSAITEVIWADELGSGNQVPRCIMLSQSATYLDACYSGQSIFTVYNTNPTQYVAYAGTCPTVGVWRQYVGVYNGVTATLYVNGVAGTPVSASGALNNGAVTIGEYAGGSYNFNGLISNVQVYSTALSATQVQQLYQEGVYGIPLSGAGLVGWWPLNGNAQDYSNSGYNGTATAVVYPYFSGTYNTPGLSSITSTANEWQALGLANT